MDKKIEAKVKQIIAELRLKVKQTVKKKDRAKGGTVKMGKNRSYSGVPGGIRTHDPLLRRQLLYPPELQGQHSTFKKVSWMGR